MRVRFDWALYAVQTHSGHGWRAGSSGRHGVPAGLDEFTDLAGGSEGQRGWQPYHAGRAFEGLYAFTFTEPEPVVATEREGRVRTRVLLAPLSDVVRATDITPVLNALQEERHFTDAAPALELELPLKPLSPNSVATHVLETLAVQPALRVVHVGQSDAPSLVAQVWSALWPQARAAFSFRLHFDPAELPQNASEPPQLVITPTAHRWTHRTGFAIPVAQTKKLELLNKTNPVASEVLEHSTNGERSHWRILNNLTLDIQDALAAESVASLCAALTTLDVAPVTPTYKQALRSEFLSRLTALIPTASATDLVPLTLIPAQHSSLTAAIIRWATTALDDPHLPMILSRLINEDSWVADAVQHGLKKAEPTLDRAQTRWRFWTEWNAFEDRRPVFGDKWDVVLAATLPRQAPSRTLVMAQDRGWWAVVAKLLARLNQQTALDTVLDTIPNDALELALATLQQEWGHESFVQTATQRPDSRTLPLLVRLLRNDPSLLRLMKVELDIWINLWVQVLPALPDVWAGTPDPRACTEALLNRLQQGRAVPELLLEAVGATESGNLIDFLDREALWPHLPPVFRITTALAWLTSPAPPPAEPTLLHEAIRQVPNARFTAGAAQTLLAQAADTLSAQLIVDLTSSVHGPSDAAETALDRAARHRPELIGQLYALTGRDAPPLLLALYHRFPWHLAPMPQVHVARRFGEVPAEEVWWLALLDVLERAFPDGPNEPWVMMGGKRKHLQSHGSVDEQWKHALERLRKRPAKLLGALLYEAGQNLQGSIDTTILWETRPNLNDHPMEDEPEHA